MRLMSGETWDCGSYTVNRSGAGASAGADSARECGNAGEPRVRAWCVRRDDGAPAGRSEKARYARKHVREGRRVGRVRAAHI